MPCPDPSLPTYSLIYSIAPFTGVGNVVTNIAATAVAITGPAAPGSTSVVADPTNPPAGIRVTGAVNLNISISDGERTSSYTPLGLGVQTATGKADTNVFPLASVSGTTITLTDYEVPGSNTSYEFLILFQSNNGNFGGLDPRIGNM